MSYGNVREWCSTVRGVIAVSALAFIGFVASCSNKPSRAASPSARAPAAKANEWSASACFDYVKMACTTWGEDSDYCSDVKRTSKQLSPQACTEALHDVPQAVVRTRQQRKVCDDLVSRLCAEFGKQTDTCELVTAQTKTFSATRCEAMSQRYREVVTELRKTDEANKPLTKEWTDRLTAADAPALGPENAPVTLIEFADFECPFSAKTAALIPELRAKFGARIRIVFRHFPLTIHVHAKAAALASMAALAQGKFWEYHDELFQNSTALSDADLIAYAKKLKLNLKKFETDRSAAKGIERIDADIEMATKLSVPGTPMLYVNGARVKNPTTIDSLSAAIDKALTVTK